MDTSVYKMDNFDLMEKRSHTQPSFISKQVLSGRYAFIDLGITDDSPFSIASAGREECAANYEMNRSNFSYFAVEYIARGRWELSSDHGTHEIGPGSIFAYSPETSYRLKPLDDHHLVKFFVDFKGRGAEQKLRDAQIELGVPVQLLNTRWVHDIFDQILALSSSQLGFAKSVGTMLTELMFMRIKEDRLNVSRGQSHSHTTYMRCRRYILRNYIQIARVDDIARACHIDAAYLSRLFRRFAGEAPSRFLTRLKMASAGEFLLVQKTSVKEVAAHVGYDDPYHFSRVFKSHYGLSPQLFVKEVQRGG